MVTSVLHSPFSRSVVFQLHFSPAFSGSLNVSDGKNPETAQIFLFRREKEGREFPEDFFPTTFWFSSSSLAFDTKESDEEEGEVIWIVADFPAVLCHAPRIPTMIWPLSKGHRIHCHLSGG